MTLRGTATPAQSAALMAVLTRTIQRLDIIAQAEDAMSQELREALKVFPMEMQQTGGPFWNVGELKDGDPQGDLWSAIRKLHEVLEKAKAETQAAAAQGAPPPVARRKRVYQAP